MRHVGTNLRSLAVCLGVGHINQVLMVTTVDEVAMVSVEAVKVQAELEDWG